jgi:polar amino acid transport system substrate-binding protein
MINLFGFLYRYCLIFLLFFIGFISTSVLANQNNDKKLRVVNLNLYWQHQFEFAGFYAAKERGYYQQFGIDVIFNEKKTDSSPLDKTPHYDGFGIAGMELFEAYHQGEEVKLLANYFKRSPLVLITHPEFTKLSLLVGQTIFASKKQFKQGSIRDMLKFNQVDPELINHTVSGDAIKLFQEKKIAGMLAFVSDQPYISLIEYIRLPSMVCHQMI